MPSPFIVLANREPYEHHRASNGTVELRRPTGGLVSALDPVLRETGGVWVAWGSGSADRDNIGPGDRVGVPPEQPSYTLRRVWLDECEADGYYLGFANSALWPLCHLLVQHFSFRAEHWECYKRVNERFATAVLEEAEQLGANAPVWVQDYHFALVPALLREARPRLVIHQFWHIPFPPPDILRLLPTTVYDAVLRGLLGNDLLAFQTERYAHNFLDCVDQFIPEAAANVDAMRVEIDGRVIDVGAHPISIDVAEFEALAGAPATAASATALREQYAPGGRQLGVSVDRADYTKGIPERLRALDLLFERSPELRGRFTFVFVAVPSRNELVAYQELESEVATLTAGINVRFGTDGWTPIVLLTDSIDAPGLAAVYRAADLCLVSSLQDGMNLVAKEYVACQTDERGVLVLSRFTGAADEIDGALLINPFNVDGFADGIRTALEMPDAERRDRMGRMRRQLREATIFDWLDEVLGRVEQITKARALAPNATDNAS